MAGPELLAGIYALFGRGRMSWPLLGDKQREELILKAVPDAYERGLLPLGGGDSSTTDKATDWSQGSTEDVLKRLLGQAGESAEFGLDWARETLPESKATIGAGLEYWLPILMGDERAMTEMLQPEISSIVSQYDTARESVRQFLPRGGQRSRMLAELPFEKASEVSRMFQTARPMAAGAVTDIGALLGDLGLGAMGAGGMQAGSALQALLGLKGLELQRSLARQRNWANIGIGAGQMAATLLGNWLGSRGGG